MVELTETESVLYVLAPIKFITAAHKPKQSVFTVILSRTRKNRPLISCKASNTRFNILVHFCSRRCQNVPLNMTSLARDPPHASTSCRHAQFLWTRASSSAALSVTIICIKFGINLAAPPCNYVNSCSKTKCGFQWLFPLNL